MRQFTCDLRAKPAAERSAFIEAKRASTWGHAEVLDALRSIIGNKCWYSEVSLEGADPNVDHFRPKGRVTEVDQDFEKTGNTLDGYWWLAFDENNYRLTCMHSNQRRTDETTDGGKADFFPVRGGRASETDVSADSVEDVLALNPCSFSDVSLLWFDPDGKPCSADRIGGAARPGDAERVRTTIWLYHLDKKETAGTRFGHMQDIRKDLQIAVLR